MSKSPFAHTVLRPGAQSALKQAAMRARHAHVKRSAEDKKKKNEEELPTREEAKQQARISFPAASILTPALIGGTVGAALPHPLAALVASPIAAATAGGVAGLNLLGTHFLGRVPARFYTSLMDPELSDAAAYGQGALAGALLGAATGGVQSLYRASLGGNRLTLPRFLGSVGLGGLIGTVPGLLYALLAREIARSRRIAEAEKAKKQQSEPPASTKTSRAKFAEDAGKSDQDAKQKKDRPPKKDVSWQTGTMLTTIPMGLFMPAPDPAALVGNILGTGINNALNVGLIEATRRFALTPAFRGVFDPYVSGTGTALRGATLGAVLGAIAGLLRPVVAHLMDYSGDISPGWSVLGGTAAGAGLGALGTLAARNIWGTSDLREKIKQRQREEDLRILRALTAAKARGEI